MYMNGWQMGGMWFYWIVAIAVIFLVYVLLTRRGQRDDQASPERILKQRYARGDISKEEYDRMVADIRR